MHEAEQHCVQSIRERLQMQLNEHGISRFFPLPSVQNSSGFILGRSNSLLDISGKAVIVRFHEK